jgi:hypothetical protein
MSLLSFFKSKLKWRGCSGSVLRIVGVILFLIRITPTILRTDPGFGGKARRKETTGRTKA